MRVIAVSINDKRGGRELTVYSKRGAHRKAVLREQIDPKSRSEAHAKVDEVAANLARVTEE